jgi:hypothetical protein
MADVRFGSKADICGATSHVRFTPIGDRERGFPHKVMSALPPKADMCRAQAHVCFGPQADIREDALSILVAPCLPREATQLVSKSFNCGHSIATRPQREPFFVVQEELPVADNPAPH